MHRPSVTHLTPFLLATTAIVSPAYAADVTITSPGTVIITAGKSVEFQAENGASSSSFAQVNGGVTIGSVTATAAGVGVLNFTGDGAAVNGSVGNLFRVTIGGSGNMAVTGTMTNTGAFYSQAGTLTVGGNFQNSYVNFTNNRDGTLVLNGASNSISSVLMTGSSGSLGTITLGAGSDTTVTGAVGSSAKLKQFNLDGTLATFNGNINASALNFGADGTASIRGATVNAPITTSTDGAGTLIVQPATQSILNGTIGSGTHGLKRIEMKSGTGSIVTITQAAYADEVAIGGLGTLILDTGSRLDTSSGSARAATGPAVTFSQDGLLSISSTDVRIGSVTTSGGTAGQGRIAFSGSGTVTLGAGIGTEANRLKQITISNAGTTLKTAPASANYVSTVRFSADATFDLNDGASLTGEVTTATNRRGTVVFRGGTGATIQGNVGSAAAQIKALQVGGYGSGTVDGSVYAETISFTNDPSAILTVSGNIVGQVEGTPSGGGGALTFSGATTTGGNIGTASPLGSVVFQGAGISTLSHDINASAATGSGVWIAGPGTTLTIGSSGKTITGAFNNGGTLDLGTNTVTVAGNLSGTGSIAFTVGASGTGYIVNTTNTANYAPGVGTVTITPTVSGTTIANGAKIALIRGATGSAAPAIASTVFTVAGTSTLAWTVASGAAYAGAVDLNGHTITAADTVLVASVDSGLTPPVTPTGPTTPTEPTTPAVTPTEPATPTEPTTPPVTPTTPTTPPADDGVIDTSKPVFTNGDGAVQRTSVTFAGGVLKPTTALTLAQTVVVTAANGTIDPGGNTVTLSGRVGGDGVLTVNGPGTVVVSGGVSNTGGLVIEQGKLVVADGSRVDAPVIVEGGGTLGGTGIITGPAVVSGILAPGNSPGTLTFSAPLTLTASSTFQAEIDGPAAGTGAGTHDRIVLTGDSRFTAAGTLSPILRGIAGNATNSYTPAIGQTFEIVNAQGGVSGQFAALTQPTAGLPAGTRFDAIYGGNTVTLAVTPASYGNLAAAGLPQTAAGRAAGTALDSIRPAAGTRPSDEAKPFYDSLYTRSGAQAAGALEQLAGTLHADTLSAGLANRRLFGHVVEARQAAARGGDAWTQGGAFAFAKAGGPSEMIASAGVPGAEGGASSARPAADQGFTVWGKPLLSWGRTDSDANAPGSTRRGGGVLLGGEFATEQGVTAGLAIGYLRSEVKSAAGGGTGKVDSYQATLYAGWTAGGTFVDAALGYGLSRYDTTRTPVIGGFGWTADSSADGRDWSAEIGAGHRFTLGTTWFEPRAGLRWERVQRDGFTESGAGPWSLGVGAETITALRSAISARMGTVIQTGGLALEPTAMLSWEHDFRDTAAGGGHGFAGTAFRVKGAEPGRDAAVIGAGIGVRLTDRLKASVGYTGELRQGDTAHTATAGLRLSF
ncbi:autotransporter outer membrane beta-barrel domain-containing protein [Azospirillum soli]|uniref:autotransporter outer membrane beta-barrel domain-containing protein n=1 Tax=Azospirillum soli TaxID=1304799 RepID=UPI001AE5E456|nr:autotransporter outer membrane beta-barrel domain-containing protein [Azospirillum soli]MBP2316713.1 outer membrane autotransporter protein [Azospirillum soli]